MKNIITGIILWILSSSLTEAEYSGSKDGFGKKSGFDSTYNGYLGEYAGHLSAGKASLGELHGFGESSQIAPEHGSQFEEGESHNFSESFGDQNDDDEDSSHFDRYSGSFESLKFPQDVEAHHYSGGVSSEIGSNNHNHNHHHHHFENHNYQFDEPAKSSDFKGYHSYEGTQIVPYSGSEETEQDEESPPKYSGYEHSEEENEVTKAPAESYEPASKAPAYSYSHFFEASKEASNKEAAAPSYSHSFEDSKASKGSPSSYSHFYEASKPAPTPLHIHSQDSSKIPASSSYSHSFEAPKASSSSYESHKAQSFSLEPSLGSYGGKYQHVSAQEVPSKHDVIQKYKSSGLKDYHSSLQKNLMTINHGKGGYSFSSLYRS